ncbi:MAG: cysteine desulfurase [Deltaproteobacteria bacterium HGW-Deltaproteobacteria-17]|nr:MAG: cysteine desulfurase [Deltaproteobacteria bacterium HGW-Deltaproteobacteria-17]
MIYFNHAATSFPRPPAVLTAIQASLTQPPQEPGRSGWEDPLMECRRALMGLFGLEDPLRVVLTASATLACNQILRGLELPPGSHVITSCMEHNSILRPLAAWADQNQGEITYLPLEEDGSFSSGRIRAAVRDSTRLLAFTHASNVTGVLFPMEEIIHLAAERSLPLLIDASQSVGLVPLDLGAISSPVFVAGAGHKALQGPPGTGFFVMAGPDVLKPWIAGGTGVHSLDRTQPPMLPYRLEAGTPNTSGFAGLRAGVLQVLEQTPQVLAAHRCTLAQTLVGDLPTPWRVVSPNPEGDYRTGVVSLSHPEKSPSEVGLMLQEIFGIETRWGLHCAPLAHQHLGTFPQGTLRISFGESNTLEQVAILKDALFQIGMS